MTGVLQGTQREIQSERRILAAFTTNQLIWAGVKTLSQLDSCTVFIFSNAKANKPTTGYKVCSVISRTTVHSKTKHAEFQSLG